MAARAAAEPLAQRIGPYELLLDIGSGGMGTISLARATGEPVGASGFARLVAIKRPLGALASEPEVLQRFLDEARLLAQVHHANVIGIHQIGADPGGQFLVLDYIEGGTLDELITRSILFRKKLPPPIALRIVSDMLAGLHAVHEAADVEGKPLRMLHRDVSAQNVLVGRDGVARLADFGIAKAIISSTVTDKAYLQGRVPYMAPEYLRREEVDRRLDVYAAGVTSWTALAGKLPWQDASEAQIVHHAVFEGVPPLSSAGVTVAPAIQDILTRACERTAAKRYATARDMLDALEDLGRRTGWIASHAEVASLVEDLLGNDLRLRRGAIAQRLAESSLRASASSSVSSAAVPLSLPPETRAPTPVPVVAPTEKSAVRAPSGPPSPAVTPPHVAVVTAPAAASSPVVTSVPVVGSAPAEVVPGAAVSRPATDAPLSVPASVADRIAPPRRGRPALLVAGFALAAAVGLVALVWTLRTPAGPDPATGAPQATGATTAVSATPPATSPATVTSTDSGTWTVVEPPASSSSAAPAPSATALTGPIPRPPATSRPATVPTTLPTGISTSNPYRK